MMPSNQSTIDNLLERRWTLANKQQHPLGNLQGKGLDSYQLVVLIGAKNKVGASYFQVFLQNAHGEVSQQPAIIGLHNQGKYPSYNWIEVISFSSQVRFGSGREVVDIAKNGLTQQLFQYLADLIPAGGHMMVEYDSPEQQDTACSLALGIPPAATPLGYILFLAGCGAGFKDWHFAEGGCEGPCKLQGYKALNNQQAQRKTEETAQELKAFLNKPPPAAGSELERAARDRALALLNQLPPQNNSEIPAGRS